MYLDLVAGKTPELPKGHILHCFNSLRLYVICSADDTLLHTWGGDLTASMEESRSCKNWDALHQWSSEHTACYDPNPQDGKSYWGKHCIQDDGSSSGEGSVMVNWGHFGGFNSIYWWMWHQLQLSWTILVTGVKWLQLYRFVFCQTNDSRLSDVKIIVR